MTIPRVLLFAALLVLGFMIWGIHQDVFTLTQEARGLKDVIIRQPPPSSGATSQPARAVPLPRPRPRHSFHKRKPIIHKPMLRHGIIHKPTVPPVRFIPEGDAADDTVVFRLPVPLTDSIPR